MTRSPSASGVGSAPSSTSAPFTEVPLEDPESTIVHRPAVHTNAPCFWLTAGSFTYTWLVRVRPIVSLFSCARGGRNRRGEGDGERRSPDARGSARAGSRRDRSTGCREGLGARNAGGTTNARASRDGDPARGRTSRGSSAAARPGGASHLLREHLALRGAVHDLDGDDVPRPGRGRGVPLARVFLPRRGHRRAGGGSGGERGARPPRGGREGGRDGSGGRGTVAIGRARGGGATGRAGRDARSALAGVATRRENVRPVAPRHATVFRDTGRRTPFGEEIPVSKKLVIDGLKPSI
jgi:hypothetical protein